MEDLYLVEVECLVDLRGPLGELKQHHFLDPKISANLQQGRCHSKGVNRGEKERLEEALIAQKVLLIYIEGGALKSLVQLVLENDALIFDFEHQIFNPDKSYYVFQPI